MTTVVSGPTIAALTQTPRMTVNDHMRAGRYGRTFRIGRIVYVALDEVERSEGLKFSQAQIEAASAGLLNPVINVPDQMETA